MASFGDVPSHQDTLHASGSLAELSRCGHHPPIPFSEWYFIFVESLRFSGLLDLVRVEQTCRAVKRLMEATNVWRDHFFEKQKRRLDDGYSTLVAPDKSLWKRAILRDRNQRRREIEYVETSPNSDEVQFLRFSYRASRENLEGTVRSWPVFVNLKVDLSIVLQMTEDDIDAYALFNIRQTRDEPPPQYFDYVVAIGFADPRASLFTEETRQLADRKGTAHGGASTLTSDSTFAGWHFRRAELRADAYDIDVCVFGEFMMVPSHWRDGLSSEDVSLLMSVVQDRDTDGNLRYTGNFRAALICQFSDCIISCGQSVRLDIQSRMATVLADLLSLKEEMIVNEAALLLLWNCTDTDEIVFEPGTVEKLLKAVDAFCAVVPDEETPAQFRYVGIRGDMNDARNASLRSLVGSMWNLVQDTDNCRAILATCPNLMKLLTSYVRHVVSYPRFIEVAPAALIISHILCAMFFRLGSDGFDVEGCREEDVHDLLDVLVHSRVTGVMQLGVTIFERDMVAFMIPMLRSKSLLCIRYAAIVTNVVYYSHVPRDLLRLPSVVTAADE